MTLIGIPKEIHPGEKRVAATPQTILKLKKLGFNVLVESGAGSGINASDAEYIEAGAEIVSDVRRLWNDADIIVKVRPPERNESERVNEAELLREGGWLVGFIWPAQNREIVDRLAKRKATALLWTAYRALPELRKWTRFRQWQILPAIVRL